MTVEKSSEQDVDDGSTKKELYKDDKAKRNQQKNTVRQLKKDIEKLEKSIEELKSIATLKQKEIDASVDAGWSVLASLTAELNEINSKIDETEERWMEAAEKLEMEEVRD